MGYTTFNSLATTVITKTASFTADADSGTYLCNATGAAIVVTLPTARDNPGVRLVFKKTDAGGNTVTVNSADGAPVVLSAQYASVAVQADETSGLWFKV